MLIICFLDSGYLVKDKNSNGCTEYLSVPECEEFAINHLDGGIWKGTESADSGYPTGCYIYKTVTVYFNPTAAGSGQADSRQVCGNNFFFFSKHNYDIQVTVCVITS
jgi:hypothetical protein